MVALPGRCRQPSRPDGMSVLMPCRFSDACLYTRRFDIGHEQSIQFQIKLKRRNGPPQVGNDYGACGVIYDEGIVVPAVGTSTIDPNLLRQEVAWHGRERPGSIVVKMPERRLYLVQGNGRALRYGIGVGRTEALNFRGSATVGRKEQWPRWTPTASMIAATPRYRDYATGMGGRPDNPLGARALSLLRRSRYLFPIAWHKRARDHRRCGLEWVHSPV